MGKLIYENIILVRIKLPYHISRFSHVRLYQIYALIKPIPLLFSKKNNNKDGNLYINVKTDIFVTKFDHILVVLGQNTT